MFFALLYVLRTSFTYSTQSAFTFFPIVFVILSHVRFSCFCGSWIAGDVLVFSFVALLILLALVAGFFVSRFFFALCFLW